MRLLIPVSAAGCVIGILAGDDEPFAEAPDQRADIVHHGAEIVHPFLKRRHSDPIRQAGATLVEHDQSRKRRETLEVPALGGILPLQLEIRDEWRNVNEVEGSFADDLIRDVHFARFRVPGFGNFKHCVSLSRCHADDRHI